MIHHELLRSERGHRQRRSWLHRIRDDLDFERHGHAIYWDPIKHGGVRRTRSMRFASSPHPTRT
ncbi:MAG: hypothetical protein ACFCVA_07845 [Gammaproteobacteria bacterium]